MDDSFTNSAFPLPTDVIELVMKKVALDEQTDELLRSPTNIVQTIISIERSCKELRGSTKNAWKLVQPMNPLPDTVDWFAIISNPMNYKVEELKIALKTMKKQVTGTKSVLVMRLLEAFGLEQPAHASANAIIAVEEENKTGSFANSNLFNSTRYASKIITNKSVISLKDYREWFIGNFGDMKGYQKYVIKETEKQKRLEEAEKIEKQKKLEKAEQIRIQKIMEKAEEIKKQKMKKIESISENYCICCLDSSRAQTCTNQCCGKCCGRFENTRYCLRHRR